MCTDYNSILCNNNIEEMAFHLFFSYSLSHACRRFLGIHWILTSDFFLMMQAKHHCAFG